MKKLFSASKARWLIAGAAIMCVATPTLAQSDEEVIVTGRYHGQVPDSVQSLSQAVSYADLDLSTSGGRSEFRHRLRLTARYLCEKLGENDTGATGVVPSCQDAAVRDAMSREGTVEAHFAPRGTTWVASRAWNPPYPADWASRYPE